MKRSLQQHLSYTLSGTILLSGLAAGAVSFGLAYIEAKEFQDDVLRQISIFAGYQHDGALSGWHRQTVEIESLIDPESQISVIQLPMDPRPDWLPTGIAAGFHTLSQDAEPLRAFVRDIPPRGQTVVAQPTEGRNEIAINSALRTLIPLLLLLPLLAGLIVRIVRKELAPIARLAKSLDEQRVERLQPIAGHDLPGEVTPFVNAINRLLERVGQSIGQQRRFIADAAHELRSPLTALSVQAENLAHAGSLESAHERVAPLQEGIARVCDLSEQLLSLARTQAGTENETRVDVSRVVHELVAEYLPSAEAKDIDLGVEEGAPIFARGSIEGLRLVVKNALENAVKYTMRGGEVTVRLLTDQGFLVIEVVDDGPGIPAAERERVLDAFYRIPGSSGSGSGLGLAIAVEAAKGLGGVVSLHERKDRPGLLFRYEQPVGECAPAVIG